MNFANYNEFRIQVMKLALGTDDTPSTSELSLSTADTMISLGEALVYLGDSRPPGLPGLRASTMVTPLSAAVTSNAATLPTDFLELKEAYFAGERPLEVIPLIRLRELEADTPFSNHARYCAVSGETLRFWPTAGGTVIGTYYKRPAAMASGLWSSHATVNKYPELFLLAALREAGPIIGDVMAQTWSEKYAGLLLSIQRVEDHRAYAGSQLRMRSR